MKWKEKKQDYSKAEMSEKLTRPNRHVRKFKETKEPHKHNTQKHRHFNPIICLDFSGFSSPMASRSILSCKILLIILVCFCPTFSVAADTLYQGGEALHFSSRLVSKNKLFTLEFVRLGSAESSASYLGICYQNDIGHPIWIANRNKPIADNSGILEIDGDSGTMKVTYSAGDLVEFYSSQSPTSNLTATLEDSGNFVLKDANSRSDRILWQSFDDPTDTLLPGMKLGINHRTGQTWSLTSWMSDLVPARGAFTLEWKRDTHELVIKRRTQTYWTSGPLTSNTSFENIFLNIGFLDFSFINVSNADEDYIMFTVSANQYTRQDQRIFSMWQMTYDGNIIDNFTGRVFGGTICKGNNADAGCEKWSRPSCRSSRSSFELRSGSFVNTVPRKNDDNSSLSISDCMDICWNDCSCVGVPTRGNNGNNTGCTFFYGNFTPDPSGSAIQYHIIVQPEPTGQVPPGKRKWLLIILAPVGFVSMMGLAGLLWYLRRRRLRAEKYLKELLTLDSTKDTPELENDGNKGHNLMVYSAATIIAATNSFSADNKLGQGGFGPVYKAWELWKAGTPFELMDPILRESCSKDQVLRCIHVGLLCVEDNAMDRPNMSDVITMLTSEAQLRLPKQPTFSSA
ncbi:hypothetical protein SADUNF_Sadunf16G0290700 [Salix dunnii]|uniref:non-specific serine/threonine protein kinase n=1 Tax=Salix dunnii TaxID=1413687 RepID=A0A835JBG8_9ROSI|nr:hypothetical protein SADUNF_Sadunf16G0290700 [Salix dunnii]